MQEYMYSWTLWNKHLTKRSCGPYLMRGNAHITDPEIIAKNMFAITTQDTSRELLIMCTHYRFNVSFLPENYSEADKKSWITAIRSHFDALLQSYKKTPIEDT